MPSTALRYRAYAPTGAIINSGDMVDGYAAFDAGIDVVSIVAFYTGPVDDESVCGSVLVNHSGPVSVTVPE